MTNDCIPPLDTIPDGHLKSRMEELLDCIRTDERHLDYLKSEYTRHWEELCKRTIKPRPDE